MQAVVDEVDTMLSKFRAKPCAVCGEPNTLTHKCKAEDILKSQIHETVVQEAAGVTVRMATITCPCGWVRGITLMHKCLYCGVWLCTLCAEKHFGKTIADHKAKNKAMDLE